MYSVYITIEGYNNFSKFTLHTDFGYAPGHNTLGEFIMKIHRSFPWYKGAEAPLYKAEATWLDRPAGVDRHIGGMFEVRDGEENPVLISTINRDGVYTRRGGRIKWRNM